MRNNFAVFIHTHGRAHEQKTLRSLRESGYTGKIYLVIDNLDEQKDEYEKIYKDDVLVFDKREYAQKCDTFINKEILNCVLYARNATFDLARQVGVEYFAMCDDDITRFTYKLPDGEKLLNGKATNLDRFFDECIDFIKQTDFITLSIVELGFFYGGADGIAAKSGFAWGMGHFWIFGTDEKIRFNSVWYEDRIFSDYCAQHGLRALSTTLLADTTPHYEEDSKQKGGMTSEYQDGNLYTFCFAAVMAYPSYEYIVIKPNGEIKQRRNTKNANVKILSGRWKK